jgi:hypothetical protein
MQFRNYSFFEKTCFFFFRRTRVHLRPVGWEEKIKNNILHSFFFLDEFMTEK